MGKLKLKSTKDENQAKISTFFQKGPKQPASSLFSNVSTTKPSETKTKPNNNSGASNHSVHSSTAGTLQKSTDNDSDCEIVVDTPAKHQPSLSGSTAKAHNSLNKTLFTSASGKHSGSANIESEATLLATNDSDSIEKPRRPPPSTRSFLSSSTSLLSNRPPGMGQHSKEQKNKACQAGKNVTRPRPTGGTNLCSISGDVGQHWNANNASMSALLTDMGVPEAAKESMGIRGSTADSMRVARPKEPEKKADESLEQKELHDCHNKGGVGDQKPGLRKEHTNIKEKHGDLEPKVLSVVNTNSKSIVSEIDMTVVPTLSDCSKKRSKLTSKRRRSSDEIAEEQTKKRQQTLPNKQEGYLSSRKEVGGSELPLQDVIRSQGMRGRLLAQSIKRKPVITQEHNSSSYSEHEADEMPVTTSFSGEKLSSNTPISGRKFSWTARSKEKKIRAKVEAVCATLKSTVPEKSKKDPAESALLDILSEMDGRPINKEVQKTPCISTNPVVSNKQGLLHNASSKSYFKSKPIELNSKSDLDSSYTKSYFNTNSIESVTGVLESKTKGNMVPFENEFSTVMAPFGNEAQTVMALDENEADEALLDIMAELQHSLREQNELSARKSTDKKRSAHKYKAEGGHDKRLDTSISRQMDFGAPVSGSAAERKRQEVITATVQPSATKCETSDQDSLKNDDKVHLSFLAGDDAWLSEFDAEMDASFTSPMKQDLGTQSGDDMYEPDKCVPPADTFGRFVVTQVSSNGVEVCLQVKREQLSSGEPASILLQGFWCDTQVCVGDVIHVHGNYDVTGNTWCVSDNGGYIIVNPDLLISGTSVVSGLFCMRKAVLNEKFKGIQRGNIHMLHGSIVHMYFQEALQHGVIGDQEMLRLAREILQNSEFLHDMYGIEGVNEMTVLEEMQKLTPQIQDFLRTYVRKEGSIFELSAPSSANSALKKGDPVITRIADIEENVWSPRFGLKGKIDVTVEVSIHGEKAKGRRLMPLELKTGRATYSAEHKGQVALYSLMSADRRDDPKGGLLVYLRPKAAVTNVPANQHHIRGLIQLRNELVYFLKTSSEKRTCENQNNKPEVNLSDANIGELPVPINNKNACAKCEHLVNCTAYSKAVERRQFSGNSIMNTLIPETLGHLTEEHLDYFRLWCTFMHLETSATKNKPNSPRELWCRTAYERETRGEALCALVLVPDSCRAAEQAGKYLQTFARHPRCKAGLVFGSLEAAGLARGDSVLVSAENRPLIALSMAYVHEVQANSITVIADRDLRKTTELRNVVYRLDKCDSYNSMATNFTNLARLLYNSEISEKLRELVIELRPPQFELTLSRTAVEKVKPMLRGLNKQQKTAVLKVLMCKDYVLIKGFPGTGKTCTLVALVRALAALGFSLLLTAYTHSALDNLLLKLKQQGENFLRLGRRERIHPDLLDNSAEVLTRGFTSVQQLQEFYDSQRIVAVTCLGSNHVVLQRRTFDLCVVDEASQVLQPACLGPLYAARKFVLVGDPLQLPPVVTSQEARELGMAESLFHRLDATGGTYELSLQYRMNREIMRLSNELVYSGALQCGSEGVAEAKLQLPYPVQQTDTPWFQTCVSPAPGVEVVFLDTDGAIESAGEGSNQSNRSDFNQSQQGRVDQLAQSQIDKTGHSSITNLVEAQIILTVCDTLLKAGVSQTDIGVIALYTEQVRLLRQLMTSRGQGQLEVNTVDQYQGRDKSVILMSFVKRAIEGEKSARSGGGILNDARRLNVALTRAKHKLVLVGSRKTLEAHDPTRQLLAILRPDQIIKMPADLPGMK